MKTLFCGLLILVGMTVPAFAQEKFFIFPQFVDGGFGDGSYYRSTLMVQQWISTNPISCTLRLSGTAATFTTGGQTTSLNITVPLDGWYIAKTSGTQSFQGGYAALTCNDYVYANVTYAYYARGGVKLGEATVFGVDPAFTFRLVTDQTEGARLGLAIANDSDIQETYRIVLRRPDETTASTSTVIVGAKRALARFLDEIIPASANNIYEVEVFAPDFSDLSVVGLRFTGAVFSTIPANF